MKFPTCSIKFPLCSLKFPLCPIMFKKLPIMFYEIPIIVFPWSWSCLCCAEIVRRLLPVLVLFCWAVVMLRLPSVLILALLECGFVQVSPSHGLAFAGLWLCTGFPRSLSFLCWAMFFLQAFPVLFFPLLGCGYGQTSPGLACLCSDFLRLPSILVLPLLGWGCA